MPSEKRTLKIHGAYKAFLGWLAVGLAYVWLVPINPERRMVMSGLILGFYAINVLWYFGWLLGITGKKKA